MAKEKLDEDLDLGIEKEGGSKKKLIIIIAAALLLLGGGGGAAWFFLSGDDEVTEAVEEEGKGKKEEEPKVALYQALDPVFVVNLPPGGSAKMLQVGLQVMVRDPELLDFLKHNDPMLRNNLLTLFGSQQADALRDRSGKEKLQAEVLKSLNELVKKQDGPGEVEAVYFTSFVMQ